jgi:3-hydroxyisobutyrate dehydrogenase-like beta-hydroxyacid dehydrogenase
VSTIGFLGLGIMGQGMVKNLVASGHQVTAWNRSPVDVEALGAKRAESIKDAVSGFDYVMYCLADDKAVEDVVLAEGGVMTHVSEGSIVIDLSTINPLTSAKESQAYAAKGIRFLDAPVFGSKGEANSGGLWIIVGGNKETFDEAQEVLAPISETTHYMGQSGNGTKMKLVGNLIVASQLEALGEALTLAKKAGLELQDVLDVLRVTDFKSPIFDGVGAAVLADDYSPSFALKLMLKDANLIKTFADSLSSPIPSTEVTRSVIAEAVDKGWGEENASALIKVISERAGVNLSSKHK